MSWLTLVFIALGVLMCFVVYKSIRMSLANNALRLENQRLKNADSTSLNFVERQAIEIAILKTSLQHTRNELAESTHERDSLLARLERLGPRPVTQEEFSGDNSTVGRIGK